MIDRFFFYGTLMSGQARDFHELRNLAEPVTTAVARGDLYSVHDAFPAMVLGKGTVVGELWRALSPALVPEVLKITDMIEGYHERTDRGMYLRRVVQLLAPEALAYTYLWNRSVERLEQVRSGDWRQWRWVEVGTPEPVLSS